MANTTHQAPHCYNIVEGKTIKSIKYGGSQLTIYFTDNSYLCIEGRTDVTGCWNNCDDYCYCDSPEVNFNDSYYSEAK